MKAKLRSGKQGTKGVVKKYADGGLAGFGPTSFSAPDFNTMMGVSSGSPGNGVAKAFSDFNREAAGGSAAPTQSALSSLSGSSMGTPQTPPRVFGPGGVGLGAFGSPPPGGVGASMSGKGRGIGRHGKGLPKTGGLNPGMRQPLPMPPPGSATRNIAPMAAQQVMPGGRAFKKGGMVGCDWSPKSSKTMRGAARKGK